MSKASVVMEAAFVDMPDQDLLDLLGFLHEELKNIDERMGNDQHLEELEAAVKEYKEEHYTGQKRGYRLKLKSVRALAKARGLKFTEPPLKGPKYD